MIFLNMRSRERAIWAFLLGACLTALGFFFARASAAPLPETQAAFDAQQAKKQAMLQASERLRAQDWSGAEEHFNKAVGYDPNDWATWDGRAMARMGTGNFSAALDDFSRALDLNNTTANLHDHHGVALAKLCRYQEAVSDFSRAIAMSPEVGGFHFHRAQALEHCGDLQAAQADYENAPEDSPQRFHAPVGDSAHERAPCARSRPLLLTDERSRRESGKGNDRRAPCS